MPQTINLTVQENAHTAALAVSEPENVQLGAEQTSVIRAVSPTVEIERDGSGVVITVTDYRGSTSAELFDGATGERGPQGVSGQDGQPGRDGQDGAPGERGERGERGETGPAGPQGVPGQDGQPGRDGVSPTASVTQTATGATVTVTDASGTTTANLTNGQDGQPGRDGQDGAQGQDGVSPTVSVTDITGGHRVIITDATGAHSFDVMDGEDGAGGDEKPWNHTQFVIADESEQTTALTIQNSDPITEILITGTAYCDTYDGFCIHIGNSCVTYNDTLRNDFKAPNNKVFCYIQRHHNIWFGRGNVTQWSQVNSFSKLLTPDEYDILLGCGNITIASRWKNKIFQAGTALDVWWR